MYLNQENPPSKQVDNEKAVDISNSIQNEAKEDQLISNSKLDEPVKNSFKSEPKSFQNSQGLVPGSDKQLPDNLSPSENVF